MSAEAFGYLHGFASSAQSRKGLFMERALAERGQALQRFELNVPDFAHLSYSGALGVLDAHILPAPEARWALFGSSMGGYLAARWAELHPERVSRLVLLCPGFDLPARWTELVGAAQMQAWEREGRMDYEDATGTPQPLHWQFMVDARTHPPFPAPACPVLIVHGRQDETVPIESSRRFAATHADVTLVEVDDDHALLSSLPRIAELSTEFLGLGSG